MQITDCELSRLTDGDTTREFSVPFSDLCSFCVWSALSDQLCRRRRRDITGWPVLPNLTLRAMLSGTVRTFSSACTHMAKSKRTVSELYTLIRCIDPLWMVRFIGSLSSADAWNISNQKNDQLLADKWRRLQARNFFLDTSVKLSV